MNVHQPLELLVSFGPEFDAKERVRQATDIVDLLGRYMHLRRQGNKFVGLCPFHDDRHPSLQITPERQTWKCWVCDVGGDVFSFVMQREGIDFREALEMLAERANITLAPQAQPKPYQDGVSDKQLLYRAMQWAADQYHRHLRDDSEAAEARDYVSQRGIEQPTMERFHLGFVPNQWTWLLDRAKTTPYRPEVLEACGLLEKKEGTGSFYDRFRGRLLFPIRDTQQRVVAFGGRILPSVDEELTQKLGRSQAKYINSPETRLFTKSDHLYGLDVVRDEVSKSRQIVIVEGYTDVVMTWQAGVTNIAAVLGTALNERHLRLIRRFAEQVILVLDGDEAGQRRTNEVLDLFVAAELDLRVLTLPKGLDPCDYVAQHGVAAFQQLLSGASDALDHKIAQETGAIDVVHQTHQASQALDRILQTIAKAPRLEIRNLSANGLREQAILNKLARRFLMPEETIRVRLQELRKTGKAVASPVVEKESKYPSFKSIIQNAEPHELQLLEIAIAAPDKIDSIVENIPPDQFVLGPLRDVYELFCHGYHSGWEVDFDRVLTSTDSPEMKSILVGLDERVRDKVAGATVDFDRWTSDVLAKFRQVSEASETNRLISQLDQQHLSAEEEEAALARIFAQKLAEQQKRS